MRERFTKISILRTVMSIMLLAVALGMAAKVAQAAKNRATTFVLEKIEGDVRIVSSSKEEKSVLEGMQLYRGDHQITGAGSYAWMSLDASKAIKLDENSESSLKKAWFSKKLEVYSVKGKLFFNVSVPLAEDEAFNIRTSTMVTGIRGTSGWVEVSDDWKSTIFLLTGELECLVVNPLDNGSQTITLHPGEYAEFFVFPKSEIEGEEASCGVTTKTFTEEDIPGFILEEILGNDELIEKIYKETNKNIDLRNLTTDYVQKRIKADQEKHKKEKQEMEEKASEELTIVEKEPVWKPENIKASKVAYLLMPQTAKTVQKYLNEEKYQKVVLVPGSGSEKDNTLKVDIALTTPAGKTLEAYAGVPVEVLPNYSLTVDGTAHLTKLTNGGTVTVRSANTLEIEELLVNLGVLEITESGRLVLKKTMETSGSFVNSGVVEAAPDATGDEMIRINGGKVVMLSGMISSNRHDTIMRLADGAQAEFQFAGGMIANEMEDGASILAREEDFQVTVLGTDIMGVTNTILGKGAVLEKYNAGSVFRKDERYHLIELDKVDSYPVVVAKVEHGTIIAPSRVEVGAKVTLTAIPDEGYQLEYLSVNNYNSKTKKVGSSVSLSAEQSFIMPSSDVIVGGSFIEIAGEPKYQVTVRRADGGSVRASATEAKAGETIQITVQNGAGHELEGLTVKDEDGNAVGITTSGNGYAFTMPEMNVTVTPSFRTLEYNVVFYDDDKRTVLNQQTLKYGTIPKYEGTKPEKSTDAQYSYTFLGWQIEEETYAEDAILPDVTGNMVFTAVYAKKVVEGPYVPPTTYTVTWRNWDGTELEKDTGLTNGATPSYDSTIPTRDADVNVSYDFAGWTSSFGEYGAAESLPAVTGDITYTARFTSTTRKYTITWLNYNGELLETDELVPYGSMPTYDGETPEKNVEDPQYSYIFAGWDAAIVPVAGNATYKATYTQELNSYTIRFLNEDGSVMETLENVDYGTMPAYTSIPTKTGDDQYSYDFAGWNPELTTVEGDTDYTVVFTQRINKYKVIWLNEGGAPLKTQEGIEYDTIPSYPEASNPTKGTDAQYTYEFAGWKVGTTPYAIGTTLPPVHGDVTFTAYYTPTLRQFDVTFLDEDGTTPIQNTTKFDYGTLATTYAPADPTKTASGQYTYAFAGWTSDNGTTVYTKAQLPMVTDDVVYKATYTTTIHPLSVSLDAQSLDLFVGGTAATLTATITPSDAANQNVLWSSDDESVATVTGNGLTATVTAVANGTATITVKTEDGGYEASCTVTVKTSVTGVNLDKTELTVILGTTESLQATITPATASNKNLTWTSGDNNIAFASTVGATSAEDVGKVTVHPVAAGTTTITVTTEDGSFEKSCAVIVKGYTVTFVNDDDAHTQLNQQLNVAKNEIPSFAGAAQPTKTADLHYTYTFAGWQVGETKYPTGTALPKVTGDVTFTAYYNNVVIPYNVTFVDEDGTTPLKVATAYEYETLGSAIEVPATPTKTSSAEFDYTFAGWIVKGSDGSVKYMTNADLPAVTDNVIYQATYSQTTRTYAINFHYDGSDNTKIHTQQVAYGTVPVYGGTAPTKTGTAMVSYVFAGWIDADGTPGLSSVNGAKDYYATFGEEGNTFDITYNLNAGTDASAKIENAVVSYVYGVGTTLPTSAQVTRDGYEFSGWYTTATPTMNDTAITAIGTTESGAKVYYAKWTAKKNTLTLNATGGGVFALYGVNADQGSSYDAVTTHPRLSGLSEMSIGSYEYETDQTVYVRIVVSRSESIDDTEMTAPNALTVKDASGNTVTVTYDAATKFYVFTMPATDCTVEATVVNYQVTIDNTVTGGSVGTNYYICAQENDEVDLIVSASNHYTLNGFTFKNDAGEALEITATLQDTNKYVFTMPACNVTVTPVFVPDSYGITFNMNAGSDASAKLVNYDVTSYTYGAGATLPTSAQVIRDGYEFSGWYTSATPTANDSAITAIGTTESGAKVYYAKWTAKKNTLTLTKAGVGTFSQIAVGRLVETGEMLVDVAMDDPSQPVTYDYETDQTVYILASIYKGSVGGSITEMTTPNSITIQDADGNAITPTYADGLYSFTMPAKACTVTVTTVNYQVNIAEVANGGVTTDHEGCAEAGDTVKLNIVDVVEGYEFGGFTFKNDADENVTILATKVSDDQYTFTMPAYNVTVEPTFKLKTFSITFVDEDGTTVLKEATTYEYGTQVADIVTPADPTKDDDDDYHYTFNGWTPALAEVTTDQTYKATYLATEIIHVTGVSLDATEIAVIVDDEPFVINATIAPDEAENQEVIWSIPEADADIASVESDGLTALVTGLSNGETTLTVTTVDGGFTATVPVTVTTNVAGVTLTTSSDTAILGKADVILTATISPATASNKNVAWTVENPNVLTLADADATANESGVAKATIVPKAVGGTKITVETENGSCTANVTVTVKGYTVTWVNDDENNTVLLTETNVQYGTVPSYRGEAMPTKEKTDQYTYSFKGWKIGTQEYPNDGTTGLPGIKGNTTIQAYYTPVIRQYNVTFVGEDGTSVLKEATAYNYNTLGSAIVEPEAPAKASTDTLTYTFAGWTVAGSDTVYETGHLPNVTDEVTYIAKYESATRKYSVTFVLEKADGTKETLKEVEVEYEGIASYYDDDITTAPTREEDDSYVYRFNMWQPDTSPVPVSMDGLASYKIKADTEFKAVFTLVSKGLFYYFTNDGEDATPVLHLSGRKEESTWYTLAGGKLDSSMYTNGTNDSIRENITKVVIETEIHPTSMENAFADCYNLVAIENIENLKTDKVTSMEGAFKNCMRLESIDLSGFNTASVTTMENMFYNCNLESLDLSSFDTTSVTNMSGMFNACQSLKSLNVGSFVTTNVTNMSSMFKGCYLLTSLDIDNFDTEKVTDMSSMFEVCDRLTSLDVSGFKTGNVTNMNYMFNECTNLTSLNVSGWNTANVTTMEGMFRRTESLVSLDLSSFNTAKVTNMSRMFSMENEGALQTIFASEDFVTTNVSESSSMFYNCTNLVGGRGTTYDSDHIDATYARMDAPDTDPTKSRPGYFSDMPSIYYNIDTQGAETVLHFYATDGDDRYQIADGKLNGEYLDQSGSVSENITKVVFEEHISPVDMAWAFAYYDDLKSFENFNNLDLKNVVSLKGAFSNLGYVGVLDLSGLNISNVYDMSYMFANSDKLTGIVFGDGFNTSKVGNFASMFEGCTGLTSLDLSAWDMGSAKDMQYMFYRCSGLTSLNLDNVNTLNVTNLYGTFMGCEELTSLSLANFQTGSVTTMESMFQDCKKLETIDVSGFDTSYVTDFSYMFLDCYALKTLDVSGFDTAYAEYMYAMFQNCNELTALDVSGFETEYVTTFSNMFFGCGKLTELDLTNFDTSNADHMSQMFYNCFGLTNLDLSSFDTANVEECYQMFAGDYEMALTTIIASDAFVTTKVTDGSGMFTNCTNLVGGNGTRYNASNDDFAYAWIDGKDGQPGYFTEKGAGVFFTLNSEDNEVVLHLFAQPLDGRTELMDGKMNSSQYVSTTGGAELNREDITKVVIEEAIEPTGVIGAFNECYSLKSIEGMEYLSTAGLTSMEDMFNECDSLETVDLSHFDTSSVTSMFGMFKNCSSLKELDLSSFDTRNVDSMGYMFYNCTKLRTIYVLDNGLFDVSLVEDSYGPYNDEGWDEDGMFSFCEKLMGGAGTRHWFEYGVWNPIDKEYARIDGKDGLPGYFTLKGSVDESSIYFTLVDDVATGEKVLTFYDEDGTDSPRNRVDHGSMFSEEFASGDISHSDVTKIVFEDEIYPSAMAYAFNGMSSVTAIENFENLHTDNVTSLRGVFGGFGYEGDIDLSEWNVSNVVSLVDAFNYSKFTSINVSGWTCPKLTNMEGAFESCSNLTSLTIDSFSAPNLTDLSEAFAFCTSLESIDLSGMSTPKLEYMYETFKGNTALKNVNLDGLDTSKVTTMESLFENCSSLVSLDLSYLDTSSLDYMRSMFESCSNLETVNLDGWDTSNVTVMHSMFRECAKLKEVDLSGFDTSSLTNIGFMFDGCYSLTTIDLSSFDTSNVTMSWYMFYASNGDHNLTTIYASDAFDLSKAGEAGYGGYMFNGRAGLIGGEGSTVTSGHEDCTYARVDGGAAAPGYFTDKTKIVSGLYYTLKADGDDVVLKLYGQSGGGRTKLTDDALNSDLYVSSAVGAATFDKTDITKVIIMEEIKPSNMENAFNGCSNLKTIEGIDLLDTSEVTSMSGAFQDCEALTELDLSGFDTSKVTDMSHMFENVYRVDVLDLSSFDTKKVTDMSYMFRWCYVTTIYASDNFDVTNVTEDASMFYDSSMLIGGRGTRVSYSITEGVSNPIDKSYARIDKVGQPGYFTDKNITVQNNIYYTREVVDDDNITVRFYNTDGAGRILLPNNTLCSKDYASVDDPITIIEIVDAIEPYNMAYAFADLKLNSIIGLDKISTVNVADMSGLFYHSGLTGTLDISTFDTTNVTNMDEMFSGNDGLTDIVFGSDFTTSNVESMYCMFYECSSLNTLDLTKFDTAKVTNMTRMFQDCSSMAAIDVPELETDSLTNAAYMFRNCSSVEALDMSNFDTSKIVDMTCMFAECTNLTSLDLSSFDTANVTSMDSMFMGCSSLTSIDVTSFDTRNVEAMDYMFCDCTSLTEIDVSSFDTVKVREYNDMFAATTPDTTLKTIYASPDFVVSNPLYSWSDEDLFTNRTALEGGHGTTYKEERRHGDYACIDSAATPGFFTEKSRIGIVSLSGEVGIGKTLTVTVTDTDPSVGTLTYAWKRIDKNGNEEYITGETGTSYTATEDDVAHLLACEVSGTLTTVKVTAVTETRVLGDDKAVTFNMNGINGAAADYTPEEQTVAVGGTVAIPGDFPEFIEGNAFAGWYTEAACTTEWNFEKDLVEDDLELFAKWNAPIYWRVDDSSGYPTLYLESSGTNGGEKLLTQKFSNVDLAPWSGTDYEGVEIVDDIYPTYLSYWFSGESSLSYIEGWEHLHTDDVIDMSGLFAGATNLDLSTLDLSNFNTARVRNMSYMFQSAGTETDSWLDSWFIDLTSFNTSNVENMNNMFESAERLRAIYVSDNFVTSKVTAGLYMFSNCYYLTGANGTRYSEIGETNSDYAWIDGKDGKPGYLSRKPETAHAIHMLYLDEYGGSMGEATWTESTDRATPSFYVNNSETSLNQAKQYDRVNIFVSAKPGYKITETPVGSDERRDSITSNNADYQVGGTNVNGEWGVLSLRMPDHDIWVYAKAEPKEEQTAGSITTYYKVWNDTDETFTTTPAGGTVATTKSNGDPVDAVSQGDVINLTITPKEGYRLAKLRAVRWYVDAEVEYEFGTSGGDNITEITYDAEGVGTAQYTISEVMDDNRLILEATFMKDMEYSLQFMQYVDKGRDGYEETEDAATITAKVGDNAVTKVATGDLVELTIAPEVNYRVKEMEAKYVGGWDEKEITLLEDKTKDNVYYFNVESTYFDAETYIDIMAVFTYGYKVTKGANPAGGSFTVAVSGSYEVENVAVGDEVVIQVYTETGMTWDQIIVKDADGNAIELTQPIENVGIFTFAMPASDVTVSVTFKATAENTTVNLTQYQSATKIQQYLNTSGVSEVKLSPSTDNKEYTIDSSLTIPEGKKLIVDEGAVLKVATSITVMAGATLQNDGELVNMGTIEANTSETVTKLINNGTLFNAGNIIFSDPAVVENYGEYVAIEEPSSFDNHNTASTLINTSNEYVGACGLWAGYGVWDNETSKALKFYGMGDMNNYTISETAPWYGSRQSITTITIPEGITSIGNYAFKSHTAISEIVIPEGVTSIGQYAFDGCSNLATVTLPTTLTFLGGYAFNDCAVSSLSYPGGPTGEGIYLPPKLEYLTERCFYNCPLAATVVVGHNVKQLGYGALGSDTENETLQEIWLPFIYLDSIYAPFANRSGLKTIYYEGASGDWAMIYISDGAIPDGVSIEYGQSYNY